MWPLEGDDLGKPITLAAGQNVKGLVPADYDGDGTTDIAGIVPDDPAPVRIWFGQESAGQRGLGAQVIFEMPPITVFEAVQLPGHAASRIAVIERASKRVVVYDLASEQVEDTGNRDASFVVHSFDDPGNRTGPRPSWTSMVMDSMTSWQPTPAPTPSWSTTRKLGMAWVPGNPSPRFRMSATSPPRTPTMTRWPRSSCFPRTKASWADRRSKAPRSGSPGRCRSPTATPRFP